MGSFSIIISCVSFWFFIVGIFFLILRFFIFSLVFNCRWCLRLCSICCRFFFIFIIDVLGWIKVVCDWMGFVFIWCKNSYVFIVLGVLFWVCIGRESNSIFGINWFCIYGFIVLREVKYFFFWRSINVFFFFRMRNEFFIMKYFSI